MADAPELGADWRTPGIGPKKIESGLLSIAQGKGTSNPLLASIFGARRINQLLGGAVVGPWDLSQLTDDWADVFWMIDHQLPTMQTGVSQIEARKAAIRAKHPTYRRS